MRHNKRRQNQLFTVSVIIAAVCAIVLYLSIMIIGFEQAKAQEPDTPTVRQTLPQKCSHLRREPDPATWDEVNETYPDNTPWMECMGVERR